MKEKIGKTAGIVWRELRKKQSIYVLSLPKKIKEKSAIIYQALGWLAREDKIEYHNNDGKLYVSLTEPERNRESQ